MEHGEKHVIRPRGPAEVAAASLVALFDAWTRAVVAGLWFLGAAFAVAAATLAAIRLGAGPAVVFLVPAVALAVLAVALLRAKVWAMAVSAVLLALQIVGVLGTTSQLMFGIDPGKAAELQALGCDPTLGVAMNLAFSLVATCVWAIALLRYARRSRKRP